MKWPSAVASIHDRKPVTRRPGRSAAVRIDVEEPILPAQTLRLDLQRFVVAVPMAVRGHLSADRNRGGLQARTLGPRGRRQDDVPELAVDTDLEGGVRSGDADRRLDDTRDF